MCCPDAFGLYCFWWGKKLSITVIMPPVHKLFFSLYFEDFFLVFVFQQLDYVLSRCLFSVKFFGLLDMWTNVFHQLWDDFGHYFLRFLKICPFSSPSGAPILNIDFLDMSLRLFIFIFYYVSDYISSFDPSLSLLVLSSDISNLMSNPSSEFFKGYCNFQVQNFLFKNF